MDPEQNLFNTQFKNSVSEKIIKKCKFKKLYKMFINNKKELEYNNLINYVIFQFTKIKKNIIIKGEVPKQYLGLLLLFDDNGKLIFNSFTIASNQNIFYDYDINYIINNTDQDWYQYYNYGNIGSIYTKSIISQEPLINNVITPIVSNNSLMTVSNNTLKARSSTSSWKQTVYVGYYFDYNTFNTFIDTAFNNGVTHIILEFIVLRLNNDGTNDKITFADTVFNWQSLGATNQNNLLNKIRNYGMTLMAAFGGATSFTGGFQQVLSSPNYSNPYNLANDLVNWLFNNNCPAIDLNIEFIPTTSVYSETINLVNYLGNLSADIKKLSNSRFGFYIPVSHAPQGPYFNGTPTFSNYNYIYNQVEYLYGWAIDFYNIQYYNQGFYAYSDYNSMFVNDTKYYSSVQQLINASSVSNLYNNIPVNKIVVGKCVSSEVFYSPPEEMGFVTLFSSNVNDLTMNNYVIRTSTDTADLQNWYASAGIMVWLYRIDQSQTVYDNTQLLSYYNSVQH